ncbi:MAG: glycosyltransferase family 4 protein [Planctomycetes bacterium]|nr:glycosyltransferase family 4 protein [Planctomycetota bacterium]
MADKSRLLIVSGSFPNIPCGMSGHVKLIAERIVESGGYEVSVLTSVDPLVNPDIAYGYTVFPSIQNWDLLSAYRICREIISHHPDIVHIQNPTIKYTGWHSGIMSVVAPMLKKMHPSIRLVVTQHDIAIGDPWWRWRYYPLFCAADAVIVSNSRDYQAVIAQGIEPGKVYQAPVSAHFVMHDRTEQSKLAARKKFQIPPEVVVIAYFGFVHPGRKVDVLIRTLSILKSRMAVHGIIIGGATTGSEAYYLQCQQLAEQLGLKEHITWTGYASDEQVADGLAAADVFVSLLERGADMRNTSVISAILAQLPVVTTINERYYRDEKLDKLGCAYVAPDDPQTAAAAIESMLKDPPPPELRALWAEQLEPNSIWKKHVNINLQAFRGEQVIYE